MADNTLEYIFRARNTEQIIKSLEQLIAQFQAMGPAGNKASDALDDLDDKLEDLENKGKKTRSFASGFSDGAKDILKMSAAFGLAELGVGSFTQVLQGVKGVLSSFITEAAQSEQAAIKLAFSLQSIGQYSRKSAQDLKAFSQTVQETTTIHSDEVLSIVATLQQVGRLSGAELEQATQAVLDANAATGRSVRELSLLFSRVALGQGAESLREMGLVIDTTTPKTEQFAAAMKLVERSFGGSAQEAAKGYTGQLNQMKNAWKDAAAAIGTFFLPALTGAAQNAKTAFESLERNFKTMGDVSVTSAATAVAAIQRLEEEIERTNQKFGVLNKKQLEEYRRAQQEAIAQTELGEIRLQFRRGDIEEAKRSVQELLEVIEASPLASSALFANLKRELLELQSQEIPLNITAHVEAAQTTVRNAIATISGPVPLEVLISTNPKIEEIRKGLDDLGKPKTAEVQYRAITPLFPSKFAPDEPILIPIVPKAEQDKLIAEYNGLQNELDQRQLEAIIVARLDRAKTEDEIAALGRTLQAEVEAARKVVRTGTGPEVDAARQLIAAYDFFTTEAQKRLDELKAPQLEAKLKLETQEAERSLDSISGTIRTLTQLGGATSFRVIDVEDAVRGMQSAEENAVALRQAVDAIAAARKPSELLSTYDALTATLTLAKRGTIELDEALAAEFENQRARVKALLEELQPLEEGRKIVLEAELDIKLGNLEEARAALQELIEYAQSHPEIDFTADLSRVQSALERAEKAASKSSKSMQDEMRTRFSDVGQDLMVEGFSRSLGVMESDMRTFADFWKSLWKSMVDYAIRQLARIAATKILGAVVRATAKAAEEAAGEGGGPRADRPPGTEPGHPGPMKAQQPVQPLQPITITTQQLLASSLRRVEALRTVPGSDIVTAILGERQERVKNEYHISMLESADFESYWRRRGARAVRAQQISGRS